jgi:hypothetical protein
MALAVLHAGSVLDNPTYRKRKEGLVETTENATSSRNTKYRRVAEGQLFS